MSPLPITQEHVEWAYRILLDREPEEGIAERLVAHLADTRTLRNHVLHSTEYALKNGPGTEVMGDADVLALLHSYGIKGRLFVNLSDYIGLSIARGEYEREEVKLVQSFVRPGDTFIDMGANIGFYAVVASAAVGSSGRVFAIEALARNLASIKASVEENPFCSNVTVVQAIVGDRHRDDMFIAYQPLEEGSGNSGGSFIVAAQDSLSPGLRREHVPQESLDDLVPADVKIDFIKIDIEGAEGLAMAGASRILKSQAPVILSEVHTEQLFKISGIDWKQYFAIMQRFQYLPYFFKDGKLTTPVSDLKEGVYNVAFVKT